MSAGNFSFVKKVHDREYLEDAYKAMESASGSWKMLKEMNDNNFHDFTGLEGYAPMSEVLDKLVLLGEHSGSTFYWTFHKMRAIAVNGWDGFVEEYSGKL